MHVVRFGCLAAALTLSLAACSHHEHRVDTAAHGASHVHEGSRSVQDQGWAALVEADREIKDLAAIRDGTRHAETRAVIERQIVDLRRRSDKLLDDMSIGEGRAHDAAVRADVADLHRAMRTGAAEMQREERRP